MARKAEPSITYYRINCNHIHNKKVKLLFNEFGSDGYWVWQCILASSYGTTGYYFDCKDREALELFALDVCKMRVAKVDEIIAGCLRRSLFDERVFKVFGVLTSQMMQEVYLDATNERRKKTSVIELKEDYLLIDISPSEKNIVIIPGNNEITPGSNPITPGCSTQSREEERKEEKRRESDREESPSLPPDSSSFEPLKPGQDAEIPPVPPAPPWRPYTGNRLEEFEENCLNASPTWQANIAKALFLPSLEDACDWIRKYFSEMRARDEVKLDLQDTKKHCFSWIKREIEKMNEKKQKQEKDQPRRGVEAALGLANVKRWNKQA